MPLSWNEIRARAIEFSKEWKDETSEDAEAKSFWDAFFGIFGVPRRRVASFEKPVKRTDGSGGYIDLLWKGTLLVEHKSRGKDLDRAYHQATDYFYGLKDRDLPRYVLVSDFARFRLYDLDGDTTHEFALRELHKHVRHFAFIAGYETQKIEAPEEAANIRAAEQLGKLHDLLKASGYEGHPLEVLLVRLLFCLFADDTGIFDKHGFREYLEQRTGEDGSDLGMHLSQLFQVLNTPEDRRQKNLDEQLATFRYVNGKLFEETLPIPAFSRAMRETLLDASVLDWSAITPAIFGSLFQSIMDKEARRNLGAHYTREVNILKALRPLLLDSLDAELASIGNNQKRLVEFQKKLANIRILDPACGCGNFLVIAYRELRKLELEVLRRLFKAGLSSKTLDVANLVFVDVDQFHGIEIEEFPVQIAQVALWLTDHQMNLLVSEEFGQYFARLPLAKSPSIARGNALLLDWSEVADPTKLNYIVGNPPFIGAKFMTPEQRDDTSLVFQGTKHSGVLDYVACWYRKAAELMKHNPAIRAAFVSTNSITQGEQVGVLWPDLLSRGTQIHFAHRTFEWTSEARGKAAVHCVVIGYGLQTSTEKLLFEYETIRSEPHVSRVRNINPYLVDAPNVVLRNRELPICSVPRMGIGNKPIDNGQYLFTTEEKNAFLRDEPQAEPYFFRWIGSVEFLNGIERWCLWLGNCPPSQLRTMPQAMKRIESVQTFRRASKSAPTRKLAAMPTRFHVENMPRSKYLVVPEVSSERRAYIPIGFVMPTTFSSNLLKLVPDAQPYHFAVISSVMHMSWVRAVCGRLKSDYRYSSGIVYNNFPWPIPSDTQLTMLATAAQGVLDSRSAHPEATLAELYDPLSMPASLVKAHQTLDRAVDAAYGRKDFKTEAERVAFLFERYQALTAPLDVAPTMAKKARRSRRRLS
ncbi:MAG: class I SAM-dependent DNA methyltransferase [Steroidobacteraceae bacterium]